MTYTEKIIDVTTGEETIREYTAEEIAQFEADKAAFLEIENAKQQEKALKDAARQEVLDKLGLTADEVAALLG
jgi:hypothetical protein